MIKVELDENNPRGKVCVCMCVCAVVFACVCARAYLQRCQQIIEIPHTVLDLLVLNSVSIHLQQRQQTTKRNGSPKPLGKLLDRLFVYVWGEAGPANPHPQ